ncbi:uncharacterized protein BJ212DRAFT_1477105 [Suillus subaureus]|uniref:Uncharacterized protein n=1 Tax=Suillus subaureus TaxID=48587 RepID=A0A9P7EJQ5_9AGAM|nr:uncharacterized protein BJ212DRAFT_1477105 [Suillus subaureus]KAG1822684.1 hypothetical protein BJ212DRAFT_1477105 [Suillus subaureus]
MPSDPETIIPSVGECGTRKLLKLTFQLDYNRGAVAPSLPVVLIFAQLKYNTNTINEIHIKRMSILGRDFAFNPRLVCSFDVNKPGAEGGRIKVGDSIYSAITAGEYTTQRLKATYHEKNVIATCY